MKLLIAALAPALTLLAAPSLAQESEIGYPEGSLAYRSLISADYALAERQLRTDGRVKKDDPAKLINYGLALAKTGRPAEAREAFNRVLAEEELELILADGTTSGSHDVARRGLAMLKSGR